MCLGHPGCLGFGGTDKHEAHHMSQKMETESKRSILLLSVGQCVLDPTPLITVCGSQCCTVSMGKEKNYFL